MNEPYDDNSPKHTDCCGWAISQWQEYNDPLGVGSAMDEFLMAQDEADERTRQRV